MSQPHQAILGLSDFNDAMLFLHMAFQSLGISKDPVRAARFRTPKDLGAISVIAREVGCEQTRLTNVVLLARHPVD